MDEHPMLTQIVAQLRRGECSDRRRHTDPCATCDAVDARIEWLRAVCSPPGEPAFQTDAEFLGLVRLEASRQRALLFPVADEQKAPADWAWTLGSLVSKAVHRPERRAEHLRQAAALLLNWHRHVMERGE